MQKFKVSGPSVPKTEWKQMDGETDGGNCITSHGNVASNNTAHSRLKLSEAWFSKVPKMILEQTSESDQIYKDIGIKLGEC